MVVENVENKFIIDEGTQLIHNNRQNNVSVPGRHSDVNGDEEPDITGKMYQK